MNRAILVFLTFILAACKPDVDIKMSTADIIEVASSGQPILVDFDARIEDKFTTIDEEKRTEVEAIADTIERYFPNSEVDVSYGSSGFEIEVEGELELATGTPNSKAPWFFKVSGVGEGRYLARQQSTQIWNAFSAELIKITFLAKPDDFLPVNVKLKNQGGSIIVGGAILDGQHLSGFEQISLDGTRVTLSFDGDHWKKAPASFLFIAPE